MSTTATPDQIIAIGITSDVGDVAVALAAIFKAGDDLFNALNSPTALAARRNADVQAILTKWDDDLKQAQATGYLKAVDTEASG